MKQRLQEVIHAQHLCDVWHCLGEGTEGGGAQYEIKFRPTSRVLSNKFRSLKILLQKFL